MGRRQRRRLVLQVRIEGELIEGRAGLGLMGRSPREALQRLMRLIRRARDDRRVAGLMLSLAHPDIGWAKAASLSRAIRDFRGSGKPTLAYLEGGGNLDYFLANACETLVLPPSGTLHVHGLQAEVLFFKDLLDWMGVEAEVEAVGEYKSAGEMFVRREMSAAYREELTELLKDLSEQWLGAIGTARSIEPARLARLIDDGPYLAEEAKRVGLIDRIAAEDACASIFEEGLGAPVVWLPHGRYRAGDGWLRRLMGVRRPCIAIVYAVGIIAPGGDRRSRSPRPVVGARSLGGLLKRLRESRRVKAVVVRIDSPGGTALGSELLWREIHLTRKVKPVIVSMGDVAASGGYYVAAAADAIVAEASTLTGSIGVIGGKVVVRRLLDRLGVHRETLSVSEPSSFASAFRPFSAREREKLVRHLRHTYEKLFVPRVAEGRGMSEQAVHEAGRGRVWTGRQAMQRGLVDEIGDLDVAVELAKRKAELAPDRKVRTVTYARRIHWRHLLPGRSWTQTSAARLSALLDLLELAAEEDVLFLMPSQVRLG